MLKFAIGGCKHLGANAFLKTFSRSKLFSILEYIILNKQSNFEVYKLLLPVFNLVHAFLFEEMENDKMQEDLLQKAKHDHVVTLPFFHEKVNDIKVVSQLNSMLRKLLPKVEQDDIPKFYLQFGV